jgi:hypothetical protein
LRLGFKSIIWTNIMNKTLCNTMKCMFQPYSNPHNKKQVFCVDCWSIIPDHISQNQWKKWLDLKAIKDI